MHRTVDHPGYCRSFSLRIGIRFQAFFVQGSLVNDIGRKAEVFLRDLKLHGQRRLRHRAEKRVKRLAGLKINRPVFYLHHYIVGKKPVQGFEFIVSLFVPVAARVGAVHESAPDDPALVRAQGFGQHIGAVGMGAAVFLRAGFAFGIGFD